MGPVSPQPAQAPSSTGLCWGMGTAWCLILSLSTLIRPIVLLAVKHCPWSWARQGQWCYQGDRALGPCLGLGGVVAPAVGRVPLGSLRYMEPPGHTGLRGTWDTPRHTVPQGAGLPPGHMGTPGCSGSPRHMNPWGTQPPKQHGSGVRASTQGSWDPWAPGGPKHRGSPWPCRGSGSPSLRSSPPHCQGVTIMWVPTLLGRRSCRSCL